MFEYRVNWYDDYNDKETFARGLVSGKNYSEALQNVLNDYLEKYVIDIYLQELEDTNTIELEAIKLQFDL